MPIDIQVLFVIGLESRQNRSTAVHLTVLQDTSFSRIFSWFACGSKNHGLFVAEGNDGIDAHGASCGEVAGQQGDGDQQDKDQSEG